jgi:predicted ATPase/class 3 adenylate cyclase
MRILAAASLPLRHPQDRSIIPRSRHTLCGVKRVLPPGTVTLVFTDIEGSTRLLDELGEAYGTVLGDHRRLLRAVWAEHGGVEVDTEGDAFFVAFAEAPAAVSATIEAQRRLAAHAWADGRAPRVRMGVHTGTPQIQDGAYWGPDVHYAARLASAANGGQVLVSSTTRPLLADHHLQSLGEHALKDFATPRELFHVVIDGAGADAFPPPRTLDRPRTNLPVPAADLVGRDDDLADLIGRCTGAERLVTVAGAGGSGKTRLVVELGHRVMDQFDGVWFVALEELSDPGEVIGAVARTLGLPDTPGVPEIDRVIDYVRTRRLLLLLDNAEHVLEAAPQIGQVAAAGDGVRVVVTSQAPLRVAGEHVVRLQPLRVPSGSEDDPATLAAVPAVVLLLRRARAAGSSFELSAANAAEVARLCRQLEGMPLAIELAAARLDLLDPASLSRRLERGIDGLGTGGRDLPARQRGLRAVLEWSCGLLADEECRLLARLSAFAAGFTPELAEAAFGEHAVECLAALLDVGLVRRHDGGRLALRPPVRRYAAELLATPEEDAAAHRAVATAVAELAERFEKRWLLEGGEGRLALNPERGNIAAALDWARDHEPVLHARLAAATGWWMNHSDRATFSSAHLELALKRVEDPRLRARCLQALGTLGLVSTDPTASVQAADAWRDLGDVDGEVVSLLYGANLYGHRADGQATMELVERAAAVMAGAPYDEGLAWMLDSVRADGLMQLGHTAEADALLRPLFARAEPGSWRHFWAATKLADLALVDGRPGDALALYGIAMKALEPLETPMGELIQADTVAVALARLGRLEDAATTLAICELAHAELSRPATVGLAQMLAETRSALSEEQLAAGRRQAEVLGVRGGMAWVGALARGELA